MKRFIMIAACATLAAMAFVATSHTQEKKSPSLTDKIKIGPKFAVSDLAVVEFMGAYDGTNYNVGGTIKNVGKGEYSRTRSVSGAFEGREVRLYSVPKVAFGRLKLLKTYSIPNLKINQSWTTPTMTISPKDLPGGPRNVEFLLSISSGDGEPANDSKKIAVSLVR